MRIKLTTLLFGLLLAVGWTGSAFAQSAQDEEPCGATYTASDIKDWTFDWVDASGNTQTSYYVELNQETGKYEARKVTNAYEMYGMLRAIYTDKNFPGPYQTAYKNDGTTRERDVDYGQIAGGWSISNTALGNITITANSGYVRIYSITLYDENDKPIEGQSWTCPSNYTETPSGMSMPSGWTKVGNWSHSNTNYFSFTNGNGSLVIPANLLGGRTAVRVDIVCSRSQGSNNSPTAQYSIKVNDEIQTFANRNQYTKKWNVVGTTSNTAYKPEKEGYTAIVVAVNNNAAPKTYAPNFYNPYDTDNTMSALNTREEIIAYLDNCVDFIKLLTDGLRIGSRDDYSRGTVFNCDGTFNKFFFLSKGQSRQKDDEVITLQNSTYGLMGEDAPFKEMFEQFSPTGGNVGDQITDFYDKIMQGEVYPVVHDCASVIQNAHQFSLSGNTGESTYPFSGMNFFIPDYRLKYWADGSNDGRTMNPWTSGDVPSLCSHFAQYNQTYAPKVGIYKITLVATAEFVGDAANPNHNEGNKNYKVTLQWVSSLDQMAGHPVTQIYTVYYWDPKTGERKYVVAEGITDGKTGLTTVSYLVDQEEHSYILEYIVYGTPNDNEHPAFEAWSNRDYVVIPGWNDFVGLKLDHHESDFVITTEDNIEERNNWYRNFLAMVNEDITNGLSVSNITGADESPVMNEFNLYRFLYNNADQPILPGTKIATVKFDQASSEKVHYKVTYEEGQDILETPKYTRAEMDVPDEGWIRVKGNGDLVIWPNNYTVNFKSITIKNGNSTVASWNASSANTSTGATGMPSTWECSPGSKMVPYTVTASGVQDKVCYMEGGGYLYIPNMLPNENLKVEIVAYSESAGRIAVNDHVQLISEKKTYTWGGTGDTDVPISPNAAPKRDGNRDATTYEKVTSSDQLVAGKKYIFVYENGANSLAMGSYTNGSDASAVAVTLDNGVITANDNVMVFTLGSTGTKYTFTKPDGGLMGLTLDWDDDAYFTTGGNYTNWVINGNSDGYYTYYPYSGFFSTTNYYIKYNTTYNFHLGTNTNTQNAYLYVEKESTPQPPTPVEGGQLRLHLLMVDQLKAKIEDDNSHPDAYGYVLKWEQPENVEDHKKSGTVRVNIQKTDCEVMGYYTLKQIDDDKDRGLTMDVITADVEFDLSDSNDLLYAYNLQAEENSTPDFNEDYVTILQRQEDFTYREMLTDKVYPSGEHHYYDDSEPIKRGVYNDATTYMSYAPSVSTWGIQRRYFEEDGFDNTYGGPIWKTAVGKAEMSAEQGEQPIVEFQEGWNTSWTVGGKSANLYMLDNIHAIGYLPPESLTKVKFEPYMFRIFVESKNGLLRPYKYVEDDNGNKIITADEDGSTTGPTCVWSGYMNYDKYGNVILNDPEVIPDNNGAGIQFANGKYYYTKNKVERDAATEDDPNPVWDKDANNAIFGALDELVVTGLDNNGNPILRPQIPVDDLKIFVRFYFCVKGEGAGHTVIRGESSRSGNGAESDGSAAGGTATGLSEVQYLGEAVSTTYYNAQGMVSDQPFDGINIVVTRFSNGATSVSKVVR